MHLYAPVLPMEFGDILSYVVISISWHFRCENFCFFIELSTGKWSWRWWEVREIDDAALRAAHAISCSRGADRPRRRRRARGRGGNAMEIAADPRNDCLRVDCCRPVSVRVVWLELFWNFLSNRWVKMKLLRDRLIALVQGVKSTRTHDTLDSNIFLFV